MRTTRIELEGSHGSVAIERPAGSSTIRIDSVIRNPRKEKAWMTWQLPATTGEAELFEIATIIQRRCDGAAGTNSMIHDYFRELERFAN